jgi:type IV pilus assembly protein PilC
MKAFKYTVQEPGGKIIRGILDMKDKAEVFGFFRERKYRVMSVGEASGFEVSVQKFFDLFSGITREHIVLFIRQLSTLVRSGLPLAQALESLALQERNQKLRVVVEAVKSDIEKGTPFSEALAKYPKLFSQLMVGMVQAGETGGMLDETLDRLSYLGLQELEIRTKLQAALTYPVILIGVALLVLGFLLISAVPKFLDIFRSSQAELPMATTILLNVSGFLRQYWFFIILGIMGVSYGVSRYYATPRGRHAFDKLFIKLPVFGDIYLKISVARLTRSISALTRSGIPLLQALTVSKGVTNNVIVLESLDRIRAGVSQGKDLTDLFQKSGIFPPMVVQMVSVGENTGKLDEMLGEVAKFYDLELEYFLRNLTSSLEPILLLFMGLMVGFIALAVLMPVFNLVKVFRQ